MRTYEESVIWSWFCIYTCSMSSLWLELLENMTCKKYWQQHNSRWTDGSKSALRLVCLSESHRHQGNKFQ